MPGARARKPGQKLIASAENASSARSSLSSKQMVVVGVAPAVFWKHEQALLMLGVAKVLT